MQRGVAAIGLCSWDRFLVLDRYPDVGGYATVLDEFEQPGGTTSNTCAALARLGVPVSLASRVGNDERGSRLIESLEEAGCDTSMVTRSDTQPTDSSEILITDNDGLRERTIIWFKGAQPAHGDRLDVDRLLDHRWFLVDVNDDRLRAFILSLPAHLSPRTQLVGAMTYLTDSDRDTGLAQLLDHDVMFGNQRELVYLTGRASLEDAIADVQSRMPARACRAIYLTLGAEGSLAIRADSVLHRPGFRVEVMDTTGAGDAFVAGALWGLIDNLDDAGILTRANAAGALCCTAMGARAGLPLRQDALNLIANGDLIDASRP